jgi:The ARF-like 2 binding protein BART.
MRARFGGYHHYRYRLLFVGSKTAYLTSPLAEEPLLWQKMAEDNSWMLEAVMSFLRSPEYTTPVMNFIDENCTIFDDEVCPPSPGAGRRCSSRLPSRLPWAAFLRRRVPLVPIPRDLQTLPGHCGLSSPLPRPDSNTKTLPGNRIGVEVRSSLLPPFSSPLP